jgi:hypothetical protein
VLYQSTGLRPIQGHSLTCKRVRVEHELRDFMRENAFSLSKVSKALIPPRSSYFIFLFMNLGVLTSLQQGCEHASVCQMGVVRAACVLCASRS